MKKLISVLIVAVIALCFVACDKGESLRGNPSSTSQMSTDGNTTTTTHTHSDYTTTDVDGSTEEGGTTDENGDSSQGGTDTSTTTMHGEQTTNPSVITTTTKKGETTTTTRKTTTTTTKKTTTTTKKTTTGRTVATSINSSTVKRHSFNTATYTKVDVNLHKATGKCAVCGLSATQTEPHSWGQWMYDRYPTATTQGVKYRVCRGCKEEQVTYVPPTSVNTANFPNEMFDLINAERAKNGLPAFKYYTAAQSGANTRAQELMVYFSHNRPDGTKWWTIASFDKSVCQAGAENIARGYGSPADVVAAFMASSDHRANILSTKYTHMVVGYYEGAWVQIFTKPW